MTKLADFKRFVKGKNNEKPPFFKGLYFQSVTNLPVLHSGMAAKSTRVNKYIITISSVPIINDSLILLA